MAVALGMASTGKRDAQEPRLPDSTPPKKTRGENPTPGKVAQAPPPLCQFLFDEETGWICDQPGRFRVFTQPDRGWWVFCAQCLQTLRRDAPQQVVHSEAV